MTETFKNKFERLRKEWERDTTMQSFTVIDHPAYIEILNMGMLVIPLILKDIQAKNTMVHWYHALETITGEDIIPEDIAGQIAKMDEVCLEWGRSNGYIK